MGARPGEARLGDTARLRKGLFDARLSVNPVEGGCSKEKNPGESSVSDQGSTKAVVSCKWRFAVSYAYRGRHWHAWGSAAARTRALCAAASRGASKAKATQGMQQGVAARQQSGKVGSGKWEERSSSWSTHLSHLVGAKPCRAMYECVWYGTESPMDNGYTRQGQDK